MQELPEFLQEPFFSDLEEDALEDPVLECARARPKVPGKTIPDSDVHNIAPTYVGPSYGR